MWTESIVICLIYWLKTKQNKTKLNEIIRNWNKWESRTEWLIIYLWNRLLKIRLTLVWTVSARKKHALPLRCCPYLVLWISYVTPTFVRVWVPRWNNVRPTLQAERMCLTSYNIRHCPLSTLMKLGQLTACSWLVGFLRTRSVNFEIGMWYDVAQSLAVVRFVQGWNTVVKQGDRNNDKNTKKKERKDERMEDETS